MGAQQDVEREPLVAPTVPDTILGSQPTGHAAMTLPNNAQLGNRQWDGSLMSCCGSCDAEGVSTCAYVKYCTPFAWGHNMKRAFNASFWKHALAFFFFFGLWAWLYMTLVVQAGVYCAPPGPGGWLQPHPLTPPDLKHHPEKTFLGGATWQPEKFAPLPKEPKAPKKPAKKPAKPAQPEDPYADFQEKAEEVAAAAREDAEKLSKQAEQNAKAAQEKNDQLAKDAVDAAQQAAKIAKEKSDQVMEELSKDVPDEILQAKQNLAEGLAQLNAKLGVGGGRRLLHKHDDDDDDKQKKEGKNKKQKAGKKEGKNKKKKGGKKGGKKADKKHDDKMTALKPVEETWMEHEEPPRPDENPRCVEAIQNLWAMRLVMYFALFLGALYAAGKRTALRERFGIAGSPLKDKLAWLLCPLCALCQETRTLAANNVRGGTWFGPTALAVPANPLQAPMPLVAESPLKKVEEEAKPEAEV